MVSVIKLLLAQASKHVGCVNSAYRTLPSLAQSKNIMIIYEPDRAFGSQKGRQKPDRQMLLHKSVLTSLLTEDSNLVPEGIQTHSFPGANNLTYRSDCEERC